MHVYVGAGLPRDKRVVGQGRPRSADYYADEKRRGETPSPYLSSIVSSLEFIARNGG